MVTVKPDFEYLCEFKYNRNMEANVYTLPHGRANADISLRTLDTITEEERSPERRSTTINRQEQQSNGVNDSRHVPDYPFLTAFSPLMLLLQVAGLHFGVSALKKGGKFRVNCWKVYSCVALLILIFNITRAFPLLKDFASHTIYIKLGVMNWNLNVLVQAMYCIILSWNSTDSKSKITQVIEEFDKCMERPFFKASDKTKRAFILKSRIFTIGTAIGVAVNALLAMVGVVVPYGTGAPVGQIVLFPFKESDGAVFIISAINVLAAFSWLMPVVLYCMFCMSLVFIFDQFYSSIQQQAESSAESCSIRDNIENVRKNYLVLSNLTSKTDEMLSFFAFLLYLFGIVQACLNLYAISCCHLSAYQSGTHVFWAISSLTILVFVSFGAAKVNSQGLVIHDVIQKMSTEDIDMKSQTELSMLIFHISGEPVVMTLWQMIPLYKSIVISVFISLITYFTLLLQFK